MDFDEAFYLAGPQVSVPRLIESVGGFQRLSRSKFWIRDGYVEEVYRSI